MNKLIKITIVVVVSVVIGFFVSRFFFYDKEAGDAIQGIEFAEVMLNQFLDTVDEQYFLENSSAYYKDQMTSGELDFIITSLSALGPFRNILSISRDVEKPMAADTNSNSQIFLVADTEFENDRAILYIELIKENDNWKINKFIVQAQMLMVLSESKRARQII